VEDANFFEAGRDSLLLVRLIGRVRETFGVSVPLRDAVANATVRGITHLPTTLRSTP
jgi:acyl carrier protein